jgi:hypothetical protein
MGGVGQLAPHIPTVEQRGKLMDRYKVVKGSQSAHCCFEATVVDTSRPVMIGGEHYEGQYEPICECFEERDAAVIVGALNAIEDEAQTALEQS